MALIVKPSEINNGDALDADLVQLWLTRLADEINGQLDNANIKAGAAIAWAKISKTGSNLTDMATRSHTDLSDIGTNTHAQVDTHIGSSAAHGVAEVVGKDEVQTLTNKTLTAPVVTGATISSVVAGRVKIESVSYGDAGYEPDAGLYTLSIGGTNYYVQTIDVAQNELFTFKVYVPDTYKAGSEIKLRVGYASAGTSVGYTLDGWFGLMADGQPLTTSMKVQTITGATLTSHGTANTMKVSEACAVTDATGSINGVAVAAGDFIVGKVKRTNVDANDLRIVTMELVW